MTQRTLSENSTTNNVCKFSFSELCAEELRITYSTLASPFPIMVIENIPILPLSSKSQARQFISLIDALYESHCKLICLAEIFSFRIPYRILSERKLSM
ncbi:hypothetical protein BDQ17DRAFT_1346477 [Cyathus striatus]|nr:hypothetical protein BDQ17DRAFT_1346477 [Cyathus striatus]